MANSGGAAVGLIQAKRAAVSWLRKPRWLARRFVHLHLALTSDSPLRSILHRFPFVFAACFAVLGVMVDALWYRSLESSLVCWAMVAIAAALLAIGCAPLSRPQPSPGVLSAGHGHRRLWGWSRWIGWCSTAMLWSCVFGVLHGWSEHHFRSASILAYVDQAEQPIVVRGRLGQTVSLRRNPFSFGHARQDVSPWQSQLTVELEERREGAGFRPIDGTVLVYVDGDLSERRPGDRLEIYGWLQSFAGPTNPGEPDLRPSYRLRGLHGRIETKNATAVTLLETTRRPIASAVAGIATSGRESLLRHTDEQTGGLAVALVIGQREFVDPETRDALLATGTAHLLSVSGMHLAILVLVVTWLVSAIGLRPLPRLVVILAVSALYVAVTGGRPPVMRAAILIAVLLLSTCFRRPSQPLNTLAFAALLLIVINPMNVFAVGVHLSFLAVMTLMLAGRGILPLSIRAELELQREVGFQSLIESTSPAWIRQLKLAGRFVMQMAWMSACVTAVSMPLVWSQFHLVSLVSVLTNVLVWAGLMVALPMGVLTVVLDPIHQGLGGLPGGLCHGSLRYMWSVIRWTADWPGGHVWLPSPSAFAIGSFYVVMAASLLWSSQRARWLRCGWVVLWMTVTLSVTTRVAPLPPQTIEATFIDVGHGTSVILRTADQRVWLYDCGSMGNSQGNGQAIDTALWSLGITRLDGVFLSHADADHYNALPSILDRFHVGVVITPPGMLTRDKEALASVRSAIARQRVVVHEVAAGGLAAVIDDHAFSVLHPPAAGIDGSDNANSLVLKIDHQGRCLLLPGDLEPPGTERLTALDRPVAGGVLMAPHHGSLSMNADAVLAWARPLETVVSGSRRAARVEVREMLSVTGSGVHVTAQVGAVRVRIGDTGRIEIRSWLDQPW